jgi:hypothetical protein
MVLLAACGGSDKKQVEEPVVEEARPKPPPPPPPVCIKAGTEMSLIGMVEADAAAVKFCVSDGAESNQCYAVDVASKKYKELTETPKGASPVLDPDPARIETTAKEVKVCIGEECKTVKPKVPKGNENPIDAVTNAQGTHVAVLLGNAEKGKGTVEVWDVAKGKRIGNPIKYAKGDYKCGEARLLGDTLYVSASVCAGPAARGWLFNGKGKKIAAVGGAEFGTYGTVPVQVGETTWAFLDESGATIAIQDVKTGKVDKTIDIGALWTGEAAAEPPAEGAEGEEAAPPAAATGNPGESALVRGAEGKLVVVTGGPTPGSVGVIDVASGALETNVTALQCEKAEAPSEEAAPADEEASSAEGGADDGGE